MTLQLMKKAECDNEVEVFLKREGYTIILEKQLKTMIRGKRTPDLVATKNDELLVIETKSEQEAKIYSCLNTYPGDYLQEYRAKVRSLAVSVDVAKWMVHIGGQLMHYLNNLGREWYIPGVDSSRFRKIPAIVFPSNELGDVKKALDELKLAHDASVKVSDRQMLIKTVLN